jgi:S-methylmethionine-dependent homocysteine/selenocysteine methylase
MSRPSAGVILDGPMGTELARRGLTLSEGGEWSAVAISGAPEVVSAVHRDYAEAGATVHTANTFRAQRRRLGRRWEELAGRAVRIARSSVPASHRVAGSIAPLEDCYRPDLSPGAASRLEHAEIAACLHRAGVDLLLCETFPHAVEAAVAVEEAARTGIETWIALTAGPDGSLMTPAKMRSAARSCVDAGARAVLVNCVAARRTLPYVCALAGLGVPIGAYANAGEWGETIGGAERPADPAAAYAGFAATWLEAGATVLGGCCGTGPSEIARVSALLARPPGRS